MSTATKADTGSGSVYPVPAPSKIDHDRVLAELEELACRQPPRSAATPALEDVAAGRVTVFASTDDFLASLDF